jgi:biotin-dependent carboxylase-like uncharacterized protein
VSPPAFRVIQPGLHTTVQDLGRVGSQRLGIPVSGALDPLALRAANVVVGNAQTAAGLEIAVLGPVLKVETSSARVAVAGDGARLTVERTDGSTGEVAALESMRLLEGDRLRVTASTGSSVAYLAIEGGLALPPFLGSLATYVRGGFGGLEGRALAAADTLPLIRHEVESRQEVRLPGFDLTPASEIRVVLGPQDDYFSAAAIANFLSTPYTVTQDADRMGLRLEGAKLEHAKGYNIVSDGIAPGSIQVPGSGQPIVLLADRQTTGGYPKIATIASADLAALGRVRPGMALRFRSVSVSDAQAARRSLEARMARLDGELVAVRPEGPDLERLYDANLVSGVAHAHDHETWRHHP